VALGPGAAALRTAADAPAVEIPFAQRPFFGAMPRRVSAPCRRRSVAARTPTTLSTPLPPEA